MKKNQTPSPLWGLKVKITIIIIYGERGPGYKANKTVMRDAE